MRLQFWIGILLVAATLSATAILYPRIPAGTAIHWNLAGAADEYVPRWSVLVLNPGIMLAILLLFRLLPWLSPKHFEVSAFQGTYLYLMLVLISTFAYAQAALLWAGVSGPINAGRAVAGGICLMVVFLGNVLSKVRRNFYLGIRTPWTLASEQVWNATHRLAGKLLVIGGLAGLLFLALRLQNWFVLSALIAGPVIAAVYSLVFYKILERRGGV